jgi:DNA modification methylase
MNNKLKPFWKIKNISIYNGDILNLNNFPKEFCDLIITSPPYNNRDRI